MNIRSATKFCHYTSIENARNILCSESLFLSRYDSMNDLVEARMHAEDNKRVFVLSFCNSEALNIPVFYLYGGIDGKGCRIQFTDSKIREVLQNATLFYVNNQHRQLKTAIPPSDYDIYADWVHYISSDGYSEHKIEGKKHYGSLEKAVDCLRANNKHYFIKSPVWKYEKEFRIVVVFKKEISYRWVAIRLPVKRLERGISLLFGPETTDREFKDLSDEFQEYGIREPDRAYPSAISMKLVSRNRHLLKQERQQDCRNTDVE